MIVNDLKEVISFPKGFPPVSSGVLLRERNALITGHENGLVVRWDINKGEYSVLLDCNSPVRTLSYSGDNEIAVGCESGGLFVLRLDNAEKGVCLQEPQYSKYSRVWRAIWIKKDMLIITSTYGVVKIFNRTSPNSWEHSYLRGHSHSVFGIASSNGEYVVTGDYRGNLLLWKYGNGGFENIQTLSISGNVQDIHWYKDEVFAAITKSGRIFLFEKESADSDSWRVTCEIDVATGTGNCVNITDDGKTIFAATNNEVIQFDTDFQQTDISPITGIKRIFSRENTVYALNNKGLYSFERKEIEVRKDLISYKFVKVGLLGHTGTGKTTLCNYIVFNSIGDVKSTFGKRVWNWILPKDNNVEKRIILSDHGGQEAVLETFLPFLKDSDMFLIFFKQTDKITFQKALRILDLIKRNVRVNTKIMFVQTFIDHEMNEIPEIEIQQLKSEGRIIDNIKISPKEKIGLEEFRERILNSISWDNARIMVKSPYREGILKTLIYIQEKGHPAVDYGKFKTLYENIVNSKISDRHLKFLLKDYTNQGIIEYYPEIIDLIIFNDENYNKLMTNIPIYAEHKKGIVSIEELAKEFKDSAYLRIIDEVYARSKISIKNGDLRIFPEKLTNEPIEIPAFYKEHLKESQGIEIRLPNQLIEIGRLIQALSEINLQCIKASQREGIFAWSDKAYIYYSLSESGDDVSGRYISCKYYIGGKSETRKKRLTDEFNIIIEKLYGILSVKRSETSVKKKEAKKIEFDVALSFAGEQRKYVKEVATILASKGIKVFYDEFYESHLWGKNLAEYLKEVYYSRSNYCIMFISKEYLSKMWPAHERKCATARDIEKFGEYILPVVFNEVQVPGMDPAKKYLSANKYTPREIAEMFIEKYEAEEK
jgi:GTPase SAR1 family protein